jgi:LmbE family N-acetylglucosaminyl deacetylase
VSALSLLGSFAHPDDEQLITGTLAQCASEGVRTGLICATRGEAGRIHEAALALGATRDNIGQVREAEMRCAALTVGVKDLRFLDYRDSGWFGAADNDDPRSFCNCDRHEALGKIVRIIRDFKPNVIVTFDAGGAYGHYDHLMINKLTTEAFTASADPVRFPGEGEPWQASRLYYSDFPNSLMRRIFEEIARIDPTADVNELDIDSVGGSDDLYTYWVDVARWREVKDRSLRCHRSQSGDYERWSRLSPGLQAEMRGKEYFAFAAGTPLPHPQTSPGDIFAGLR